MTEHREVIRQHRSVKWLYVIHVMEWSRRYNPRISLLWHATSVLCTHVHMDSCRNVNTSPFTQSYETHRSGLVSNYAFIASVSLTLAHSSFIHSFIHSFFHSLTLLFIYLFFDSFYFVHFFWIAIRNLTPTFKSIKLNALNIFCRTI